MEQVGLQKGDKVKIKEKFMKHYRGQGLEYAEVVKTWASQQKEEKSYDLKSHSGHIVRMVPGTHIQVMKKIEA